ncbi:Sbal_3080 family lipoprotein [Shewanella intestini]|uniref:Lipoprotein n=1 Tax=Shewanella intestini TaxID=2017544 RepID=A0ABS5I0F0_9GAMM|nr:MULTISPECIES: Sbal_3080 family lipoprotein [Shewanella]MBR9727501.1 hypothetical protein [Shewanella intestini]MRG35349.1 hypothetical protein [Shewanella sp. XMDDZSB0408]
MKKSIFISLLLAFSLTGCGASQTIHQFEQNPQKVCVAVHKDVREGVLKTIKSQFEAHNIQVTTLAANYNLSHGRYSPLLLSDKTNNCDAIVFYTANWNWDLALYMSFANIWATDKTMTHRLADAKYIGGKGFNFGKFINADEKIRELVDKVLVSGLKSGT